MDPGPADTVSTVSDLDESLFKREKACLVCSQAFNSAAMVKHSWYSLPSKICHTCGLAFAWRKKWTRDWDNVKFCSERCRNSSPKPAAVHE